MYEILVRLLYPRGCCRLKKIHQPLAQKKNPEPGTKKICGSCTGSQKIKSKKNFNLHLLLFFRLNSKFYGLKKFLYLFNISCSFTLIVRREKSFLPNQQSRAGVECFWPFGPEPLKEKTRGRSPKKFCFLSSRRR